MPEASPVARIVLLGTDWVTSTGIATPAATRAKKAAFCTIPLMVNAIPPSGTFRCRDSMSVSGRVCPRALPALNNNADVELTLSFEALDKSVSSPRKGSPARPIDSQEWEAAQGTPDYVMQETLVAGFFSRPSQTLHTCKLCSCGILK